MKAQQLSLQLAKELKAVLAADKQYTATLAKLRAVCKHERVSECGYSVSTPFSDAEPPRRICEDCGIEEMGWGCGYEKLNIDRVRSVGRDTLESLRRDLYWVPTGRTISPD